jgi:two-component system, NarL family, response regulator DesR
LKSLRPYATSDPITVIVVDDHEAVRAGLERVLERTPDLEHVAGLADDRELLSLLNHQRIDVAVLDYDLERGDGLSLCLRLKQRAESPAVVIYSGYAAPGLVFVATVAQADAVVSKAEPVEVLLSSIRRLGAGERLLEPPAPELLEAAAARLSMEDLPVMALLADRAGISEIALALGLNTGEVARRARRVVGLLQAGSERRRDGRVDDDELIV